MGSATRLVRDLIIYSHPIDAEVPAATVIGTRITVHFALALDLAAGKMNAKQVLFAK